MSEQRVPLRGSRSGTNHSLSYPLPSRPKVKIEVVVESPLETPRAEDRPGVKGEPISLSDLPVIPGKGVRDTGHYTDPLPSSIPEPTLDVGGNSSTDEKCH